MSGARRVWHPVAAGDVAAFRERAQLIRNRARATCGSGRMSGARLVWHPVAADDVAAFRELAQLIKSLFARPAGAAA